LKSRKGKSRTKLGLVWRSMIGRCYNPNDAGYARYGGRGISIYEPWLNDFEIFETWAISNGYVPGLSIDRIDNDGNYHPDNCRWITCGENAAKTSRTWNLTAFDETKTIREWVKDKRCKVSAQTLRFRIYYGWSPEEAIAKELNGSHRNMGASADWRLAKHDSLISIEAFGEVKPLIEWLKDDRCVVGESLLRVRLKKLKWSAEKALTTKIDSRRTGRRKIRCHQQA